MVVADLIDVIAYKTNDDTMEEERRDLPHNSGINGPEDMVEGYTIRQIEDALVGLRNWNSWRDNIIRRYDNSSEVHVVKLFQGWQGF